MLSLLNQFVNNNLNPNDDESKDFNGTDEYLIAISDTILGFYNEYSEIIDSLKYDSIQNDETLSGINYMADIMRLTDKRIQRIASDLETAFENLNLEEQAIV